MVIAKLDGADIYYEIVGSEGPWVAIVQGGRSSLARVQHLARAIAMQGYRVIIHDSRNCGRSSMDFDSIDSEDRSAAKDLCSLLHHIDAAPAIIVGQSKGARVAIQAALQNRPTVLAMLLWGLSGGPVASRYLDDFYYLSYIRAVQEGGMEAVCAIGDFAELIKERPERRASLIQMDPVQFFVAMRRWRATFLAGTSSQVIGVSDEELMRIDVPTAIVPYYDRLHTHETASHAHRLIRDSLYLDFAPSRHGGPSTEAELDVPTVASLLHEFVLQRT